MLSRPLITLGLAISIACGQLLSEPVWADGPSKIAKADRQLWPEAINTVNGFDKASRASILIYALTLQSMQKMSDSDMLAAFKIKSLNRTSVEKWLKKELFLSLVNYQRASANCATNDEFCINGIATTDELLKKAAVWRLKVSPNLLPWSESFTIFTRVYVSEQLRLAALFPKISSEIDHFNDNEFNGDSLLDRQFFLTFDDGPSNSQGSTDDTLKMLATEKKSAIFFVLGNNLQSRLTKTDTRTLAKLYQLHCIASHGWEHQSHAKWEQWQDSVKRTQALVATTIANKDVLPLFRPPYGQRKADSGAFFQAQGLRVALWNLDSQDWNSNVTSNDIVDRMIGLMLIKRHGVLLFHDIHPKAKIALPVIFNELGNSVSWQNCHQLVKI